MKTFIYISCVVASVLALSACVSQEAYLKEYKESTGVDLAKDGAVGRPCEHYAEAKTNDQYQAARMKCAAEASEKPYISEQVISYSELKNGYELQCYFGGYDRLLILDRLSKGVGLVQPVYLYGDDGAIAVDWPATEKLISLLKNSLKLNVRPVSDSKAYAKVVAEYRAPKRTGSAWELIGSIGSSPVGNKHYTEIVSKLSPVDYVVAPSQDVVDAILSGDAVNMQEYFKLVGAAKNADDPTKRTFKPAEIQQIQGVNNLLEMMIRKNAENVKLDFQLTERMKAFNEKEQSFTQRLIQTGLRRGCEVADLSNRFVQKQVAKAEAAGANNKTFAQRLTDMVQIDTSRGLDISLSNEQSLRDQFISEQKKLKEMKVGYQRSMNERYQKVNDQLTPFTARAFQQFKATGFTQSKKL